MILFRVLLALFPRAFRDAFGAEMREVFIAQRRAARAGGIPAVMRLYARTSAGMIAAAWRERRERKIHVPRGGRVLRASDLRYAIRRLAAAPGFTAAVVGTLALCIGANLAIFAVVHSILLRPLPFQEPDRLVTIYNTYPRANVMDDGASIANYYERRGRIRALTGVSLYRDDGAIVGEAGRTEREFVMRVSPDFFATLAVAPAFGRAFVEEETTFGRDRAIILSDAYWRQQYAADRTVVGRRMRVNGLPYTIVGVLPREFSFLSSKARLFLPLASGPDDRQSARRHWGSSSRMVARLAPGVAIADAQAQIDADNAANEAFDPTAKMIADAGFRSVVTPLHARHVASIRPVLLLLQAGAGVLLLIGLVNVANLLLVRASSRSRELAVRRAIGARPWQILAALTAEAMLLSAAGAAAGIPLAQAGLALLGTLGASRLPLGAHIAFDASAAIAAAATAMTCGLILGAATAWHHLRGDAGDALRADTRGGTTSRGVQRTRHTILVAQIALSFVLLSGAALLGSTLRTLMRTSPGFAGERLLTAQVQLAPVRYRTGASLQSFIDRLTAELRATPGVVASGVATNVPLSGNTMKSATAILGRPTPPGESPHGVYAYAVAGDYFAAMGIPLREGRYLSAADAGAQARACVVDEDYARRYWPNGGAIGQRLFLGSSQGPELDAYTIVGIVAPVKQAALSETDATGAVYYPYSDRFDRALYVVIRSSVPADALQNDVRRIVRAVDPEMPVNNMRSMEVRIADSLVAQRSPAILGAIFSIVALLLTALGTYGVLSYAVSQRRREIGVRIALGARPRQVGRQFLGAGLRLLAWGLSLGVAGSWAGGRALRSMLPGVPQAPVAAVLIASTVMAVVCIAACLVPARRASRVAPIEALSRE
jgi:putative ABC transport system permease protein